MVRSPRGQPLALPGNPPMPSPEPSLQPLATCLGSALVISKAGPHPRKQRIVADLHAAGLPFTFLDATMGADLGPEELAACYDEQAALHHRTGSRRLHASMIGCFLSHRRAWQEVRRGQHPSAIILEDDAMPVPGFHPATAVQAVQELPADWDLLYLGVRGQRLPPIGHGLKRCLFLPLARLLFPGKYRFSLAEYGRLYQRPFSAHLHRAGYHQGTHAYAVSRRGAEKLLGFPGRISAPPDAFLGDQIMAGKLNAFALREELFTTTGAGSQIVSSR